MFKNTVKGIGYLLMAVLLFTGLPSDIFGQTTDGKIWAWGNNEMGQCNVPTPNSGFIAISGGWFHSLGLKSDGTVVGWGEHASGQCNVPTPNSGFVAIAAREYHSLGLKSDGTVVAWGYNGFGQCNVPTPNSGFIAIAAGGYHSLALEGAKAVFEGFFSPIENNPVVNTAKAGQTIPVEWRITAKDGVPISDPSSFKSITSYAVSCGTLAGDPTDDVEEYSAGSSGLQYLGDGCWQFNWKTPKTYAATCRIMVLTLGDNSKFSANFSFK